MSDPKAELQRQQEILPGGFTEAGISTGDLDAWAGFLIEVGGYREIWRGESADSVKSLWGTAMDKPVFECLLGSPGTTSGFIRLFQFEDIVQEEIRRDTNTWDSGGIFDLDIRVPSLQPFHELLTKRGWTGVSQPVNWQFGQFQVYEWLAVGPDSVIIALIERIAPPLEGFDGLEKFSPVFNSSQIVADMSRAVEFYEKLGFAAVVHHTGPLQGRGGEVLGLAPEIAATTPVDLVILQPEGTMSGSVELVEIEGMSSRNVAAKGSPCNLGLNLLRFPVADLRSYAEQLERRGLQAVGNRIISTINEPFGETEIMALLTPDGAWLEFYQDFS